MSWGRLGEAGKLHLGCEESWKLNKEGGQIKCTASIDACRGQVCFKFHVAVPMHRCPAAILISLPAGVQKLPQLVLS